MFVEPSRVAILLIVRNSSDYLDKKYLNKCFDNVLQFNCTFKMFITYCLFILLKIKINMKNERFLFDFFF